MIAIEKLSVAVQFDNGMIESIQNAFETHESGQKVGFMPLRVSYAVTVHKSQGKTYESAIIHTDTFFERGQAYVALSRVRNLDNCQLVGLSGNYETIGWTPNKTA